MIFTKPYITKDLPFSIPDSIPIYDFLYSKDDRYDRHPLATSKPPFVCGVTGKSYSAAEVRDRVEYLARALAKELDADVEDYNELEKVVGVFTLNAIDTLTVSWAAHRINGVSNPISSSYSVSDLVHQLKVVNAKALFTCVPLLPVALEAAEAAGLPKERIYLIDVPEKVCKGQVPPADMKTVDQLIEEGRAMEDIPEVKFIEGQGAWQTAYLCASSGTSGLPKNVMISHQNVIANCMQFTIGLDADDYKTRPPQVQLGVLPLSHIYPLVNLGHMTVWRGDSLIILPNFDLFDVLQSVQDNSIDRLYMVPPMMTGMVKAAAITAKFNLSSVKDCMVGASNLTKETAAGFAKLIPDCKIIQGYGMTETTAGLCAQHPKHLMSGSCGNLFPGSEARLLDDDGTEISSYDTPGELFIRSPSVMLGYLNNDQATSEAVSDDGWLKTGDVVEIRKSAEGVENIFLVDRKKELIKVRGIQVSPIEVEAYLSRDPAVQDVCVVALPNEASGEVPIAFIARYPDAKDMDEDELKERIHTAVNADLADYKRLAGGIEFVDALPKTGSGKTQRGRVREMAFEVAAERQKRLQAPVVESFEFDSDDSDWESDDE